MGKNKGAEKLNNEQILVEKIQGGDVFAFEELYKSYYNQLHRFAWRFVKDVQGAEDIIQDVFVKMWLSREKLNFSSNIKSYLYTAVKNKALDNLKHLSVENQYSDNFKNLEKSVPSTDHDVIEKDLFMEYHKAIDELPDQCRRVFTMRRYSNLTNLEVAQILDISINTVKTQMQRAYSFLRKRLSEHLFILI